VCDLDVQYVALELLIADISHTV